MSLFKFKKEKINPNDNVKYLQNKIAGRTFKGLLAMKLPKNLIFVVTSSPLDTNNDDIIISTGIKERPFKYLYSTKLNRIGSYWGNLLELYTFKVLTIEEIEDFERFSTFYK